MHIRVIKIVISYLIIITIVVATNFVSCLLPMFNNDDYYYNEAKLATVSVSGVTPIMLIKM